MREFFAELKRRRVVRVLVVYAAVAFAVIEAADVIAPALQLPGWFVTAVVVFALLGLPVAIVMAWAFELTPEGVKRTEPLEQAAAAPPEQASSAWVSLRTVAVAGALVIAGVAAGWLLKPASSADPETGGASSATTALAVLPFTNLTRNEETEPFVDGIHDDLLTQLSKIDALRVISRTSVQEYRNTTKNIRAIATELGVQHVVEGGVQRAGDQVRINVQLIDARTDEHLWAETYNRTLTVANIFAIQSEIAQAIATALRTRLTPEQKSEIASRPTENLEAYDHYQRGATFLRRSQVPQDVRQAAAELDAAVRLDPGFAEAWARLAIARATLSWEWGQTDQIAAAEVAVQQAERLAPGRIISHVARGYYHYYGHREYDAALRALRQAEAIAPDDPEVLVPIAWVLRRKGQFEDALSYLAKAFERDPRNQELVITYAWTLVTVRRFDEAARLAELGVSISPDVEGIYQLLVMLPLLASGDTGAAIAAIERTQGRVDKDRVLLSWPPLSRILAGRYGTELRRTNSAVANDTVGFMVQWQASGLTPAAFFLQKAQVLRTTGDALGALAHFDSARAVLEPHVRARAGTIWNYQGDLPAALGVAYAGIGRKAEAIRYGRKGVESLSAVGDPYMAPRIDMQLAEIYLVTGEPELALDQLERAVRATGLFSPASLAIDPLWAQLRSHPRFQALLK